MDERGYGSAFLFWLVLFLVAEGCNDGFALRGAAYIILLVFRILSLLLLLGTTYRLGQTDRG